MQRLLALVLVLSGCAHAPKPLGEPFDYIRKSWTTLERGPRDLLRAAMDPKFPRSRPILYVPADEDLASIVAKLRTTVTDLAQLDVRKLPMEGEPLEPGLLYLPEPYVVPGGRFNEMYGWDSFFILVGLLRDERVVQAKRLVDDLVYEVRHYGTVLNANRSYYLGRSQPPLLSAMVRRVYAKTHDRTWLASVVPAVDAHYRYFTTAPHLVESGLSRYHARGTGPAPEVVSGERDADGRTHYDRVREAMKARLATEPALARFYDPLKDQLTDLFYVADRTMRESGFDPTDRFGPFGGGVLDVAPVCLNSLLFAMEEDLAYFASELGQDASSWRARAEKRRITVERDLWDEGRGMYLDYDFTTRQRRDYPFLTTFLPLWVGLATPAHAARLAAQLATFERPNGLVTSLEKSGSQWDAPYGWAPLEMFAIEGLRRYGFSIAADRASVEFLSLVAHEYGARHAIFEKYDVEKGRSTVAVKFGYQSNEVGFGWTNGVFLELYAALPEAARRLVRSASE